MPKANLSPVKRARRAKIVAAAEDLFITRGFRATTMQDIAQAVGMSKVTVYGYFKDKDAVFDAVAETIAADMRVAFDAALAEGDTAARRIIAALIAKHDVVRDRVRRSAFASELFAVKRRASAALFQELDQEFISQIAAMLRSDGYGTDEAAQRADAIFAASQGIANTAENAGQMRDQIRLLELLIARKASDD